MQKIRLILALATTIFFLAALIHLEVIWVGYPDQAAAVAESVIGTVLLLGLLMTLAWPERTRSVALVVQAFGLLGTIVGLTLLLSVGPMTGLDLVIHLVMAVVLLIGLNVAFRTSSPTVVADSEKSVPASHK
jgi:hypothetical protein